VVIYSLLGSCERFGHDPREYLTNVLQRLCAEPDRFHPREPESLTPKGWKAAKSAPLSQTSAIANLFGGQILGRLLLIGCQRHDLDPLAYLCDVLTRLPTMTPPPRRTRRPLPGQLETGHRLDLALRSNDRSPSSRLIDSNW
jgi:hypothetical protein